jgi:hypothetical protein
MSSDLRGGEYGSEEKQRRPEEVRSGDGKTTEFPGAEGGQRRCGKETGKPTREARIHLPERGL